MEGFTPAFFLQLVLVVGTAIGVYGAIKTDLRNLHHRMSEERTERTKHEAEDDVTHRELREKIGEVSNRVARNEGANDATSRIAETLVDALRRK